jgi:carbon monoxide dehydrogenase subunit G
MTRTLRRVVAVTTMCLVAASAAAGKSPADADVTVRETSKGVYQVEARFDVAESAAAAWAVLTDYANIPRFLPDVRVSIVRERSDGQARVEQEAVSGFMLFSKRVHLLLAIQEDGGVIRFRDEGGRSFTRYAGSWRVTQQDGRTSIAYELTAQPSFSVPDFLVARVLKRDANDLIGHLRTEIARRASEGE